MVVPAGIPVRAWEKMETAVPPSARQEAPLVRDGLVSEVDQQVPRAVRLAPPFEETVAPSVAPLEVMEVAVGFERVGMEAAAGFTVKLKPSEQLSLSFDDPSATVLPGRSAQART